MESWGKREEAGIIKHWYVQTLRCKLKTKRSLAAKRTKENQSFQDGSLDINAIMTNDGSQGPVSVFHFVFFKLSYFSDMPF